MLPTSQSQSNPKEPHTHRANKTIGETLFKTCTDTNNSLSKQEIIEWCSLREEVRPLYDDDDPNCFKRIQGLWFILTGNDLPEDQLKNSQWVTFGFQGKNPTTDFRGGGIQSLDDITSYAQLNKDIVLQMCEPSSDYYFAVSSINVTFLMKKYFHLLDHLTPTKDKKEYCSRLALKNFCHFLVLEDNLWQQLHSLLLTDLFVNCWLGMKKQRQNVTIMDYGIAFRSLQSRCQVAFNQRQYLNFAQFKQYYTNQNL